jgi:biopolymer transport protein ExbD
MIRQAESGEHTMAHKKLSTEDVGGGLNLSLIITPFLDFAFQLLAFFIMTYNPSALEGHIDGTLAPPSEVAAKAKEKQELSSDLPPDTDPELAEALLVKVKAVAKGQQEKDRFDGQPSRIEISRPGNPDAKTVTDAEDTLDEGLGKLKTELERILKEPGAIKTNIKLEGDSDLKHMYMMRVYDVCKQAGYRNISFVAPKFERKKSE